jgi:death-on-curing protein
MRYLTLGEVIELHERLLTESGGAPGVREAGLLESALAQPRATFEASTCIAPSLRKPQP